MQQQYSTVNKHYWKNTGTVQEHLVPEIHQQFLKFIWTFRSGEIKNAIKAFIRTSPPPCEMRKKGYPFLARVEKLGLTHEVLPSAPSSSSWLGAGPIEPSRPAHSACSPPPAGHHWEQSGPTGSCWRQYWPGHSPHSLTMTPGMPIPPAEPANQANKMLKYICNQLKKDCTLKHLQQT